MTHDQIKSQCTTVSDYISLAVANGFTKTQICENLNGIYEVNRWPVISQAYDDYMTRYAKDYPDNDIDKKEGNPSFKGKTIEYRGAVYKSLVEAAEQTGRSIKVVEYEMKSGVKVYEYQGKKYYDRTDLKTKEKLTEAQLVKRQRQKKVITYREPVGIYV